MLKVNFGYISIPDKTQPQLSTPSPSLPIPPYPCLSLHPTSLVSLPNLESIHKQFELVKMGDGSEIWESRK